MLYLLTLRLRVLQAQHENRYFSISNLMLIAGRRSEIPEHIEGDYQFNARNALHFAIDITDGFEGF